MRRQSACATLVKALQARKLEQIGHGFGAAEQPHRAVGAGGAGALDLRFVQRGCAALIDADKINACAANLPLANNPVTA